MNRSSYGPYVPDGTELKTRVYPGSPLDAVVVIVFNPRWWRFDRWLFWAWLKIRGVPRGKACFTAIGGGKKRVFDLRVYELPAEKRLQ